MNQMLKKASSVFTAIVCAASITFSGASLVLADGEIDEQTKTTIETTAEGLTNTIIPLTEDEIAAYMESGDAFTENAMTAWDSAREELGDLKKAGSAEIEYSNDEYTATVPVEFEKEDAEFIYVFDKNLTPTSLSVDVKYSFATTMQKCSTEYYNGTRNCIRNSYHADLPDLSVPVHSWFRSTGSKSKEKSSRRSSFCTDTGSGCRSSCTGS